MQSSDQETVKLAGVAVVDRVEVWMAELVVRMQSELRDCQTRCLAQEHLDLEAFPSQILSLTEQVRFWRHCQKALRQRQLPAFKQEQLEALKQYTQLVKDSGPLNALKFKSLILDLIHHIDVLDQLLI